jgi:uncharacterized protein GlcG (DUF336 family)
MNKKRALIIAAIGALTLGTAGGLSMALPSSAGSTTTPLAAPPAAAPAVLPAAVTKLPTMPFLPLSLAQKAATTALTNCMRQGFPVTVTVVNADGITIVVLRNDGASGVSVSSSTGKALASAGFRTPSDVLGENAKANPGLTTVPGFVLLGGGLPISSGGKVVAGIGVGGAPSGVIDKACAQAGINAIAGSM